jgi:hypothetical protein
MFPLPTIQTPWTLAGHLLLASLSVTVLIGLLWRRPPLLPPSPRPLETFPRIALLVLQAAGGLLLLVQNAAMLPMATGQKRAWILVGDEALVVTIFLMTLSALQSECAGRFLRKASAVLLCLCGSALCAQQALWIHDWATTGVLLSTVLTMAAIAPEGLILLESSATEAVAWGLRLVGGTLLASSLLLTDALYAKLCLRTVQMGPPDMDLVGWWVTKWGMTALILVLSLLSPRLFESTPPRSGRPAHRTAEPS